MWLILKVLLFVIECDIEELLASKCDKQNTVVFKCLNRIECKKSGFGINLEDPQFHTQREYNNQIA